MKEQHGLSHTRLYGTWSNMKQRCNNPNRDEYEIYGGKGVSVCDEWSKSFTSFYNWSINNGYTDELSIDRIDSDGNYEPSNCRWITLSENASRANIGREGNNGGGHFKPITYNGRTQPIKDWAKELGIPYKTLHKRIQTDGWSIDRAFNTPVGKFEFNGKSQTLKEWAEELNISYGALRRRIYGFDWTIERAFTTPQRGR